jgi:hypothetical protein
MQISLYNESNHLLSIYNPGNLLNSVADTVLNPGMYYLKVEGKGNVNAPAYASLGSYSLNAVIEGGVALPVTSIKLNGLTVNNQHRFNWTIVADEKLARQTLELSTNGNAFISLAEIMTGDRGYNYLPANSDDNEYRLKVTFADGQDYYSNIVSLTKNQVVHKPEILGNLTNSGIVYVNSPGNYRYVIFNVTGKVISRGELINGMNNVTINTLIAGVYMIRFEGNGHQWTDKILRQ